jgi:hypothetical protein
MHAVSTSYTACLIHYLFSIISRNLPFVIADSNQQAFDVGELTIGAVVELSEVDDVENKTLEDSSPQVRHRSTCATNSNLSPIKHYDHTYFQQMSTKVLPSNQGSEKVTGSMLTHSCEVDHDYVQSKVMSRTFIRGQNEALDNSLEVAQQYLNWCNEPASNSNNDAKMQRKVFELITDYKMDSVVRTLMNNEQFRLYSMFCLMKQMQNDMNGLRHRKLNFVSCVMNKCMTDMSTFTWESVVSELIKKNGLLFHCLIACMMQESKLSDPAAVNAMLPRIGFVYSLLAFNFNCELSLIQRVLSLVLHDSNCDRVVSRYL